jgi:hypothetical protein
MLGSPKNPGAPLQLTLLSYKGHFGPSIDVRDSEDPSASQLFDRGHRGLSKDDRESWALSASCLSPIKGLY